MLLPSFGSNILDLLRRELKSRQPLHIPLYPLLVRARGDDHEPLIQTPPQRDLGFRDAVLLRQRGVDVVGGPRARARDGRQGAVRGHGDVLGAAEREQSLAVEVGVVLEISVELDLVDGWWDLGRGEDRFEVGCGEVGYADGARAPGCADRFELGPGLLQLGWGGGAEGRVDQVEVYVGEVEAG